eukprot:2882178-Rhodomonas_salina.1
MFGGHERAVGLQDWLWCETWCSNSSITTAKTIDLCNNPMTKEPKLDQARRIVSEVRPLLPCHVCVVWRCFLPLFLACCGLCRDLGERDGPRSSFIMYNTSA